MEVSTPSGTTRYVNLGANVVAEHDGSNTLRASYLTAFGTGNLPGMPLEVTTGSTTSHPLVDGVGSVTAFTDASGAIGSAFAYTAYGTPVGPSSGTYAYGTYGYDSGTGLYYARARYYDPGTGRFLSEDPVVSPTAYHYAGDDPALLVDPSGREELVEYSGALTRTKAELTPAQEIVAKAELDQRAFVHILEEHDWWTLKPGKGHYLPDTDIRSAILEALQAALNDPSAISAARAGRLMVEFSFQDAIGFTLQPGTLTLKSLSSTIRVLLEVTGRIVTAFPI